MGAGAGLLAGPPPGRSRHAHRDQRQRLAAPADARELRAKRRDRAREHRRVAVVHRAGGDRIGRDGRRREGQGHAEPPALAGLPARAGRFRHRLFEHLDAEDLALRHPEDRSRLRARQRRPDARREHAGRHHRHRQEPEAHHHRRGHRDGRAVAGPGAPGL